MERADDLLKISKMWECWFCHQTEESEGEMVFDSEFDTPVHESCILDALMEEPEHPEANLMVYLLSGVNKSRYTYQCAKALVDSENSGESVERLRGIIRRPEFDNLELVDQVTVLRTSARLRPENCELCNKRCQTRKIRVCTNGYFFVCRMCHSGLRKRANLNHLINIRGHMETQGWINTAQRIREIVCLVEEIIDDNESVI